MSLKEKIMDIIAGPHPAAVATLDGKRPAVRYMVLSGFSDMTLVGATMKSSNKVEQLEKNPESAITIWSGKELSDPYVEIKAMGKVYEDITTKKKYWSPTFEKFFKTPENPEFVVLVFTASEITYHGKNMASREVWTSSFTGINLERNTSK